MDNDSKSSIWEVSFFEGYLFRERNAFLGIRDPGVLYILGLVDFRRLMFLAANRVVCRVDSLNDKACLERGEITLFSYFRIAQPFGSVHTSFELFLSNDNDNNFQAVLLMVMVIISG
jgi:hypothetical protein